MSERPEPRSTPAGRPLSLVHVITTAFFRQLIFCMVSTTPGVFAPVAAPDMGVGAHLVGVLYAVQGISGLLLGATGLPLLALAAPLFGTVHAGQIVFLVVYLNIEMGRDLVVAGLALTGSQLAAVAGRIFCGWLADRRRDAFLVLAIVAFGALAGSLALALGLRLLAARLPTD